ncbi:RNA polymerase sigma factor SigZ [Sinomicrobium sp. M5D2P9]
MQDVPVKTVLVPIANANRGGGIVISRRVTGAGYCIDTRIPVVMLWHIVYFIRILVIMETAEIWKRFSGEIKGYIRNRIDNPETVKDLLQEVFAKVHLHLGDLKDEGKLRSWIYTIARNVVTDHYRKNKAEVFFPEDSGFAEPEEEEEMTEKDCLLPLIGNLPEKYRKALLLSEIQGKKQAEVAGILKISVSGAKSRIQRGRKLLQYGYMDCCDYKLNEHGYLVGEHQEDCKVCNSE